MALSRYFVALFLVSVVFGSEVTCRSLLQDGTMEEGAMEEAATVDSTDDAPIESDIPCSSPVTYRVNNDCDWSEEKFPTEYPSGPHWSPLCGTAHNDKYVLWRVGENASPGVQLVAELGVHSTLQDEVESCVNDGDCTGFVSYGCTPFSGTCTHAGGLDMNMEKPYVSLVSMIAPSPDWFTGIRDVSLCGPGGNWIKEFKKDLGAYDSGTDSGPSYSSPDEVTDPPEPIFTFNATDDSNIFYNQVEMKLYPVCSITITLDEE